jgi:ATP-binding cassette subfamily B protein
MLQKWYYGIMKKKQKNITFFRVIKSYWGSHSKNQKILLLLQSFFVVFRQLSFIISPLYIKKLLDFLSKSSDITQNEIISGALGFLAIILLIRFLAFISARLFTFMNAYSFGTVWTNIRLYSFKYLLKHSHEFFSNRFAGSLTNKLQQYAGSYTTMSASLFFDIIPFIVKILGVLITLLFVNTKIAFGMFLYFFVFMVISYSLSRLRKKMSNQITDLRSKMNGMLSDTISNVTSVQLFSANSFENDHFERISNQYRDVYIKRSRFDAWVNATYSFLILFFELGLLYLSIKLFADGKISIGVIYLVQAYIITALDEVWSFAKIVQSIEEAYSDSQEMYEILETPHEVQDKTDAKELVVDEGKIVFDNVSFSYNENSEALSDLEVTFHAGHKVGLVGPSGAGKSTFVKLLLRFFDVTSGHILIDGIDIRDVTQDSLHSAIGFVPQDPSLFHRSLMDNIRYGRRDATDEEVIQASMKAHAHEFISKLPEGYNTLVGERGIKLSGGERQRVAIARAILKNAPILVLDEATSALDSESERLIQDALHELMKKKTVLVIAHRLSTIQHMDRILVIEGGKIIEDGTHVQLVKKKNSLYKKLWNLQAGGFIK